MRLFTFSLTLFSLVLFLNADDIPSYKEAFDNKMKKKKGSKSAISENDMKVMKEAGESLEKMLPNPGLKVGDKAPNFTLNNAKGKAVTLEDKLKKGPVVLVFYRGSWCPYCNMYLKVLSKSLPMIKKLGAQLITVTPQTPDKSSQQIKSDKYPFEILSDLDGKVMKDYKLYFELKDDLITVYKKFGIDVEGHNGKGKKALPVPGSFVIDAKGVVQAAFAETDYKKRMEPSDIIKALKKLSKKK